MYTFLVNESTEQEHRKNNRIRLLHLFIVILGVNN